MLTRRRIGFLQRLSAHDTIFGETTQQKEWIYLCILLFDCRHISFVLVRIFSSRSDPTTEQPPTSSLQQQIRPPAASIASQNANVTHRVRKIGGTRKCVRFSQTDSIRVAGSLAYSALLVSSKWRFPQSTTENLTKEYESIR